MDDSTTSSTGSIAVDKHVNDTTLPRNDTRRDDGDDGDYTTAEKEQGREKKEEEEEEEEEEEGAEIDKEETNVQVEEGEEDGEDEQMRALMGFSSFSTVPASSKTPQFAGSAAARNSKRRKKDAAAAAIAATGSNRLVVSSSSIHNRRHPTTTTTTTTDANIGATTGATTSNDTAHAGDAGTRDRHASRDAFDRSTREEEEEGGGGVLEAGSKRKRIPSSPSVISGLDSQEQLAAQEQEDANEQGEEPLRNQTDKLEHAEGEGKTIYGLTPTQLKALRRGVVDADSSGRQDVVYFMPSFVQDPWASLRPSTSATSTHATATVTATAASVHTY